MLSHSKRFIFLHNYKVAGNSITHVLSKYEPHHWIRAALRKSGFKRYYPALANFPQHASALEVRELIGEDLFNRYYKFTFVRNPWDWQVSLYHYMLQSKRHHQHDLIKNMTFPDYIDWRVNHALRLQSRRFADEAGNSIVDFIGQFENLSEDFATVCDVLSIDVRLPHKNRSDHRAYRDYYDDRSRELIAQAFATDIALFGYEF